MNPAVDPSLAASPPAADARRVLRAGMVGMGMIFDETYRPFFEQVRDRGIYDRLFGDVDVPLAAVASRTGNTGRGVSCSAAGVGHGQSEEFLRCTVRSSPLLAAGVDFACVATPDDRHFDAARTILEAGMSRADRKAVGADGSTNSTNCWRSARRNRCWRRSFITSCSIPITRSSARSSPTAFCGTSTTVIARCWSPSRFPGQQFAEWIRRPQSGDVRRRPLHQADRFHVSRPTEDGDGDGAARPGRAEGRPDLGQLPAAA